jgi:hypothetical protein
MISTHGVFLMIEPGEDNRRVLMAIAGGRIRLGRVGAGGPRYLLDGIDGVDQAVAQLVENDLVVLQRAASPRLTPDGEWVLTNFT